MQLTYQSRIYLDENNSYDREKIDKLNLSMENVGRFYRTCFNNFWFNKEKTYLDLKKKEFCSQFGIGTKQANSLIREAQSKVVLWQESLCYSQRIKEIKLTQLKKREKKYLELLNKIKALKPLKLSKSDKIKEKFSNSSNREKVIKKIKRIKTKLWSIHRKQEKIKSWLNKEKSITFGSKTSQKLLSKGKLTKEEWQFKRNNFIYGIGEGDVKYGNNTIKLLNKNHIQVEVQHLEKIELKILLHHKDILNHVKKTARIIKKKIRKKVKYYVQFTIEPEFKEKSKDKSINEKIIGGTDLNDGFVSFYTTSGIWKNYPYLNNTSKSKQKEELRKLVKELIKEVDVIRIEDLNFKYTKAKALKATSIKGKKYNAMLNRLPYKMFKDLIKIEAFKAGVKVELINPKNSSKKAIELGYDRHLGAAKIIAMGN